MKKINLNFLLFASLFWVILSSFSTAESAQKLDLKADKALENFYREVRGSKQFLSKAKGYLIFPEIIKGGFMVGASHGEGVMRINGVTKHYYDVTSASFGFQLGAQKHSMVIAFMTEASLRNFIVSDGWEAGVDGTIAIGELGLSKDLTSMSYEKPILAFIYGEKGIMGGISLEGNKFRRIVPQ